MAWSGSPILGSPKWDDEGLTQTGDFLGTLRYMSPERFQGKCGVYADIYALGLTLYELALQRPAFESADRLKLIKLITHSSPARPRSIDPQLPRDLETIILKSIDKDPKRRYKSARELELDLERLLNDEPILARRRSLVEQTVRWARRNKAVAGSLAALFMMAMLTIAGLYYSARTTRIALAETRSVAAKSLLEQADFAIADRRYQSAAVLASEALGFAQTPAGQAKLLTAHSNAPVEIQWTSPALVDVTAVAISPDGSTLAAAVEEGFRILLWDTTSWQLRGELRGHEGTVRTLTFDADGELMFSGSSDQTLRCWQVSNGALRWQHRMKSAVSHLVVHSHARLVAAGDVFWGDLWVGDCQSGRETYHFESDGKGLRALTFDSGRKRLAASWKDGKVLIWNLATEEKRMLPSQSPVNSLVFLADDQLITGREDGKLGLWNVLTADENVLPSVKSTNGSAVTAVAVCRKGDELAIGRTDGTVEFYDLHARLSHTIPARAIPSRFGASPGSGSNTTGASAQSASVLKFDRKIASLALPARQSTVACRCAEQASHRPAGHTNRSSTGRSQHRPARCMGQRPPRQCHPGLYWETGDSSCLGFRG